MLSISATFSQDWGTDGKMLNGLKGKVNRAVLSKQNLDEANVQYGGARINLTDAAAYSTLLGDFGYNIQEMMNLIDNFDNLYQGSIYQVINNIAGNCAYDRQQYSVKLLSDL